MSMRSLWFVVGVCLLWSVALLSTLPVWSADEEDDDSVAMVPDADEIRRALFVKCDLNKDNKLNEAELTAYRNAQNYYYQALLRMWDANSNKVLEAAELRTRDITLQKPRKEMEERLIKRYDRDKSGNLDVTERQASRTEDVKMQIRTYRERKANRVAKTNDNPAIQTTLTRIFDYNGNGKIDEGAENDSYKAAFDRYTDYLVKREMDEAGDIIKRHDADNDDDLGDAERDEYLALEEMRFQARTRLAHLQEQDQLLQTQLEAPKK